MENLTFLTRKKLTMDKFSTQVKISTENPIKKILKVDANSVISSCDQLNGSVSLSGKIKVNIVFVSKLDEIENTEMFFDFIEKQQQSIEFDDIFAEDNVTLKNISFSGNEVICIFEHNVCLNGNYSYQIPTFLKDDKDFVIKNSYFEAQKLVASVEDNFTVAEESVVNFSEVDIISSDANVILNEIICLVDKISIEGKIMSTIVYKDSETIGQYYREFEFKQEIQANGVLPNMTASVMSKVKNITVLPEDNDGKTNLVYTFDVYAKGLIYEDYNYEVVEDMFSLNNYIKTTYDYIETKTFSNSKVFSDTFMLSDDVSKIEDFDDILTIYLPKFKIDKIEERNEKAYISGNILSDVIYKTENDIAGFETNLPVKFEINKEEYENIGRIDVYPEISSYKVKAGKYLEIIYNLHYAVKYEKLINKKFVKSFEVLSEKENKTNGIKIYITKRGETLFEVAKALSVRPETIESQNEVFDTFEQGEKIYIYSPINLYN